MAEFGRHTPAFESLGYKLAAISVDAPPRSAALRANLKLPFPLLCDPARETVKAWGLYSRWERGGIAVPATFVVSRDGRVVVAEREGVGRRIRPAELAASLAATAAAPPRRRFFFPGWRYWRQAFRRGGG